MNFFLINIRCLLALFLLLFTLQSCGRVYFPMELEVSSRNERNLAQEERKVKLIPMTINNVRLANRDPYERRVIVADDLSKPAKLVKIDEIMVEKMPPNIDPDVYFDEMNKQTFIYSRTNTILKD